MSDIAELLAPPAEAAAAGALADFGRLVGQAYGARLAELYLFGSRSRGDHRPDSDADVAVVLDSFDGTAIDEKMRLVDLGFDALTDFGLMIQPWPFTVAQWQGRESAGRFADLLESARRDARRLVTR